MTTALHLKSTGDLLPFCCYAPQCPILSQPRQPYQAWQNRYYNTWRILVACCATQPHPSGQVKTYSSSGSHGLCLSRDVLVPKVCLQFFLADLLGKNGFESRNQRKGCNFWKL